MIDYTLTVLSAIAGWEASKTAFTWAVRRFDDERWSCPACTRKGARFSIRINDEDVRRAIIKAHFIHFHNGKEV